MARSSTVTSWPCMARKLDTVEPAGPPPITTTSLRCVVVMFLFQQQTGGSHSLFHRRSGRKVICSLPPARPETGGSGPTRDHQDVPDRRAVGRPRRARGRGPAADRGGHHRLARDLLAGRVPRGALLDRDRARGDHDRELLDAAEHRRPAGDEGRGRVVTTGERRLRVLALGGADMAGVVEGLAGAIGAHTADGAQVDVVQEPSPDAGALAAHLEGRAGLEDFDVVMLSVGCGLGAPTEALGSLRAAVDAAKARGATVLLLNGSSVVPGEDRAAARATSLGIARLNHSGF